MEEFAIFLSSSVVGGFVVALVAARNSDRNIQIVNITQERAKWRDQIRRNSLEVYRAAVADNDSNKLEELRLELSLNFNPSSEEDNAILKVITDLKDVETRDEKLTEFSGRVALLLKHDWDRSKHEAKPFFFGGCSPKRKTYAEWIKEKTC